MPQYFPSRQVAEKFSYIDQNRIEELIDFLWMLPDVSSVSGITALIDLKHTFTKTALQGSFLVAAKVEAALFRQFLQQIFQAEIFTHFAGLPSR